MPHSRQELALKIIIPIYIQATGRYQIIKVFSSFNRDELRFLAGEGNLNNTFQNKTIQITIFLHAAVLLYSKNATFMRIKLKSHTHN